MTEAENLARARKLLEDLHDLMRTGRGDGEMADGIRDEMDEYRKCLSAESWEALREYSAELYEREDEPTTH